MYRLIMLTDLELITRIKEQADNDATLELINRHSGVYINVISKFAFSPKIQMPELKEDRLYNIFSWAREFDETKKCQFGSYVARKTKWMCLNLMNRGDDSVEMDENAPNTDLDSRGTADRHIQTDEIRTEAVKVKDPMFWKIFKLRFDANQPRSWRQIGSEVKLSHEGARKHFFKFIGSVRENMVA